MLLNTFSDRANRQHDGKGQAAGSCKGVGFIWGAGVGGRVGRRSVHDFGVDDLT